MDFLKVISTEKTVILDMNAYESATTTNNYAVKKIHISRIIERIDFVEVWLIEVKSPFLFSTILNSENYMKIDTVNGIEPTSIHDLWLKLNLLIDSEFTELI